MELEAEVLRHLQLLSSKMDTLIRCSLETILEKHGRGSTPNQGPCFSLNQGDPSHQPPQGDKASHLLNQLMKGQNEVTLTLSKEMGELFTKYENLAAHVRILDFQVAQMANASKACVCSKTTQEGLEEKALSVEEPNGLVAYQAKEGAIAKELVGQQGGGSIEANKPSSKEEAQEEGHIDLANHSHTELQPLSNNPAMTQKELLSRIKKGMGNVEIEAPRKEEPTQHKKQPPLFKNILPHQRRAREILREHGEYRPKVDLTHHHHLLSESSLIKDTETIISFEGEKMVLDYVTPEEHRSMMDSGIAQNGEILSRGGEATQGLNMKKHAQAKTDKSSKRVEEEGASKSHAIEGAKNHKGALGGTWVDSKRHHMGKAKDKPPLSNDEESKLNEIGLGGLFPNEMSYAQGGNKSFGTKEAPWITLTPTTFKNGILEYKIKCKGVPSPFAKARSVISKEMIGTSNVAMEELMKRILNVELVDKGAESLGGSHPTTH